MKINRVSAWNFFRAVALAAQVYFVAPYIKTYAWLSGVILARGCKFYGRPVFQVSKLATMQFGKSCVFRSSSTSNLIGINRPCIFSAHPGASLSVGSNCGFSGTVIGAFKEITIGNGVRFGANTLITDGDWHPGDQRVGGAEPIIIEDNVWLGVGVTVLKGVTVGANSVIGAGSVVTKSIPANTVAAGNPCRVLARQ